MCDSEDRITWNALFLGVQMEAQNYTVGHKSRTKIGHRTMLNTIPNTNT